jgi:hypothetical protein
MVHRLFAVVVYVRVYQLSALLSCSSRIGFPILSARFVFWNLTKKIPPSSGCDLLEFSSVLRSLELQTFKGPVRRLFARLLESAREFAVILYDDNYGSLVNETIIAVVN